MHSNSKLNGSDSNLFSIKNKTILITGAASGIAKEIALGLLHYDVKLILLDKNTKGLEQTADEIVKKGGDCQYYAVDLIKKQQLEAVLDTLKEEPIDVLINVAGILLYKSMLDTSEEEWDKVFSCNVKSIFLLSKLIARHMIKQKTQGSIIHVSSLCGFRGQKNTFAYGAAKSALNMLNKNMALELASHDIRVNMIAPGWTLTPMVEDVLKTQQGQKAIKTVPLERAASVSELLGPIIFLASQASSYMIGATINFDGGLICYETRLD